MSARAAHARPGSSLARGTKLIFACLALAAGYGLSGLAQAQTRCDATTPRVELRIFRYAAQTDEEKSRFLKFHEILFEDMLELSSETDIAALKVSPAPSHTPPRPPDSLTGMRAGWEDAWCASLLLLSGSMDHDAAGVYQVDSLIYWGQLKPEGMQEFIKARMPITPQGQLTANDTHSLVVTFALAMDAKRRGARSSLVQKLLQLARNRAVDLEQRGELVGPLADIKTYIDKEIAAPAAAQR
jgi:hypothetical protein